MYVVVELSLSGEPFKSFPLAAVDVLPNFS